jgi:hypothetical protein
MWFVPRCWREDLSAWSWRISTVKRRCQGTAIEDTAGWEKLSGCCRDLWIVEISGGAVIVVPNHVYKWLINPFTIPNPVFSHMYTSDSIAHLRPWCICLLKFTCQVPAVDWLSPSNRNRNGIFVGHHIVTLHSTEDYLKKHGMFLEHLLSYIISGPNIILQ